MPTEDTGQGLRDAAGNRDKPLPRGPLTAARRAQGRAGSPLPGHRRRAPEPQPAQAAGSGCAAPPGAQRHSPALQPPRASPARPSSGAAARAEHRLPLRAGKGNRGAAPVCSLTIAGSGACAGARPPAAPAAGPRSAPSAILRARDAAGGTVTARKEPPPSPGAAPAAPGPPPPRAQPPPRGASAAPPGARGSPPQSPARGRSGRSAGEARGESVS